MSPQEPPLILLVSAGISDLQPIIIDSEGTRRRAHIGRNNRRLHEAILSGHIHARVSVDRADLDLREWRLDLGTDAGPLDPTAVHMLDNRQDIMVEFERDPGDASSVVFLAPKLADLWKRLRDEDTRPAAVRIFTTRRKESSRFGGDEPVALGRVLGDWFRAMCGEEADVEEVILLEGEETMEGESEEGQPDLSRLVAGRVDACLRKLSQTYPNARVTLAITGGMPPIKEYLAASARLYFRAAPIERSVHMRGRGDTRQTVLPGLAEEARARRAALLHLRRGGFVEAYAAAIEFHDRPAAHGWVEPLRVAAGFMSRNERLRRHDNSIGILDRLAAMSQVRCLVVAMRTEAALHAGHWPEAINWTMTFFDAALLDTIERTLPRGVGFHDRRHEILWPENSSPPHVLTTPGNAQALQRITGNAFRYETSGPAISTWLRFLRSRARTDPSTGTRSCPINVLHKATSTGSGENPRDYRNLNTHSLMTERELEIACNLFRERELWADTVQEPGEAFMGQRMVHDVLVDLLRERLDGASPKSLYRELVQQLEACLLDVRCADGDRPGEPPVPAFVVT